MCVCVRECVDVCERVECVQLDFSFDSLIKKPAESDICDIIM